jgi:hypothetical protein
MLMLCELGTLCVDIIRVEEYNINGVFYIFVPIDVYIKDKK